MFKRVLIAEDHELANFSVQKTLEELGIVHDTRNYVFYCDHALIRIKKALSENDPYELLITDLSFDDDALGQHLVTGVDLIRAVKHIQPDLKILIFSIENRAFVADALLLELDIDGYVPKARGDAKDLKKAMETIYKDKKYLSPNLKQVKREENHYEFTAFDKLLASLLSEGRSQKEIASHFGKSLSSVEKRLNLIRSELNIANNTQLIAYCKDKKII